MATTRTAAQLAESYDQFVYELAHAPDVVGRLLDAHTSNHQGLCVACLRPGYGTPYVAWPCSMWSTADAARQLMQASRHRATVSLDKVNAAERVTLVPTSNHQE